MTVVVLENMFREKVIGGKCGRDTPGNMPNPEVKPASVDGTVRGTHGRANRCQFRLIERGSSFMVDFPFFVSTRVIIYEVSSDFRKVVGSEQKIAKH